MVSGDSVIITEFYTLQNALDDSQLNKIILNYAESDVQIHMV
jgi:hypothetical protein